MNLLRSMRVRLALSFVVLLAAFGWILSKAIAHSTLLQLHFDKASQQHHIAVALTTFMWILFPAVALGAWVLVGRTLRPLRQLSRQASEASAEPIEVRLKSPSSDVEMVQLVGTLNGLLERIELAATAKSQFYAAASHELRTPLQALGGHLETALSQERSAEAYRDALAEAHVQSQRLAALTHDILLLHQLQDQGVDPTERADLALSVQVALAEMLPLIEARNLNFVVAAPESLTQTGRQTYADVAVRNLVENAARYTTSGGRIDLRLSPVCFEISNDCTLSADLDLEGLFEPFRRSDPVRNSAVGGNGLGLAVCRAACRANGWQVSLERSADGIVARIRF